MSKLVLCGLFQRLLLHSVCVYVRTCFIFSVADGSPFVVKYRKLVRQAEVNPKMVRTVPSWQMALEESSDGGEAGSDAELLVDKHPSKVSNARVKRQVTIRKDSVSDIFEDIHKHTQIKSHASEE
jgi:hypothetical protein